MLVENFTLPFLFLFKSLMHHISEPKFVHRFQVYDIDSQFFNVPNKVIMFFLLSTENYFSSNSLIWSPS